MLNREIPFRPKLEGDFRIRFYYAVSSIDEETSPIEIEGIANNEIAWVEDECTYNLDQRKKYRAVWMLFRDLTRASWKACYRDGVLYMSLPSLNGTDMHDASSPEVKTLLRSWMSESRHERLVAHTDFIQRMEKKNANNHDVSELIADGAELADRMERACNGEILLSEAISPYLQLVTENERDDYTGIKTSDIWRYFRLTWSTPAETTPGRTMQYLIRDAAHPMHAVMGIASLENCAVQITCRDNYIGWNQKAFIEKISQYDADEAKREFEILIQYLETGIRGIDYSELCTEATIDNPSDEDIQQLLGFAYSAEQKRQESSPWERTTRPYTSKTWEPQIRITQSAQSVTEKEKQSEQTALLAQKKKEERERKGNIVKAFSDLVGKKVYHAGFREYVLVTRCTSKVIEIRFVDGQRKGQIATMQIAYVSSRNLIWPNKDVSSALMQEGIRYTDHRGNGGALWAYGGRELTEFMSLLKPLGYTFVYKESGGKATGWMPAWYLVKHI